MIAKIFIFMTLFFSSCALFEKEKSLETKQAFEEGGVYPEGDYIDASRQNREIASEEYSETKSYAPPVLRKYKSGNRATSKDFVDDQPDSSSLWASHGQTNYFFTKNRIREIGDLVSISVHDALIQDIAQALKNTLNESDVFEEIEELKEKKIVKNEKTEESKNKENTEEKIISEKEPTWADIDLKEKIGIKTGDFLIGEIVKRYPNGNYLIQSTKKIFYKARLKIVSISAVAPIKDLSDEDVIEASKLYEYEVRVHD